MDDYRRAAEAYQTAIQLDSNYAAAARLQMAAMARELLAGAWTDAAFVTNHAGWTVQVLEQQRHYHRGGDRA